jgi:hypothetical protein
MLLDSQCLFPLLEKISCIQIWGIFMPSRSQISSLKELDLLVGTGVGIASIAPALSPLLAKIIGAESYGLCWFDEAGQPQGFYHHGAKSEAEELFMNHYEELFVGPHEYTPFWRMRNKGHDVGNALRSSKAYFRSNTYNLLIKPSGYHFLLEAMVDLDGVTRLAACFFRPAENPFTETDEKKLIGLVPVMRRAVDKRPSALSRHHIKSEMGHMVVSCDGQQIELLDAMAQKLLSSFKLFHQNVSLIKSTAIPPRFVQRLCERLRSEPIDTAETEIELAGGSLLVRANRLSCTSHASVAAPLFLPAESKILVLLQFNQASAIEVVRRISAWGLSPLQARIAMYAASGGSRVACAAQHRVSQEALKKHLRQIYAASRCTDWQELSQTLAVH